MQIIQLATIPNLFSLQKCQNLCITEKLDQKTNVSYTSDNLS